MKEILHIGIPVIGFTVNIVDRFHGIAAAIIAIMTIVYMFFRIRNEIKKGK